MSIFHKISSWFEDAAYIWRQEIKQVFRDEGVLIFCVIVPLVYPLLYSWIYNNEVVHEVPVVVVDQSHSQLSRQFVRMCDASPDVKIVSYAEDLDDAQSLVSRQIVKGIYLIPSDFATKINRMEQAVVSVYCDMSLMLTYKAIYMTSMQVSQAMGAEIQKKVSGNYTDREDAITTRPLDFEDVPAFNPAGGYGNFIIPGVLMLILQQTLVGILVFKAVHILHIFLPSGVIFEIADILHVSVVIGVVAIRHRPEIVKQLGFGLAFCGIVGDLARDTDIIGEMFCHRLFGFGGIGFHLRSRLFIQTFGIAVEKRDRGKDQHQTKHDDCYKHDFLVVLPEKFSDHSRRFSFPSDFPGRRLFTRKFLHQRAHLFALAVDHLRKLIEVVNIPIVRVRVG